ncbi:MAG: PAS domain S-box protein, partial [Desulfobacterales bacterium]|nr:PAS domain S-box protein [Desulfobacterales bacterium]
TEEELRNSEESSRQILASSPIGVGIARIKDGMIMFTNTRNAEHLGCAVGELVGKSIEDLWVEPERQEEFMEIFQKEGRVQSREVQLRRPDKSSFWSLLTWEQMRYHGEKSILFWIYDIDGIKQAERRIDGLNRMKEDLLSTDRLPDKLKRITDGVVEIFDADFARVWIIGQGDLCDAGCFHAMVTEGPHVCRHRDRCLRLIASSGRYTHVDGELHRRIPFGSYKIGRIASDKGPRLLTNDAVHDPRIHDHDWAARLDLVSFAGYRILSASGDPIGVLGLFSKHPISEQDDAHLEDLANTTSHVIQSSRAEEELRKARNYIRNIFDSMPSALVGVDPNGVVNQWNREAENMMVTKGEDANGRPLTEVFPGLTGQMEKIHKAISRREPRVDARIPRHADGATRYEDVTVYPLIANGVEGAVIRVDDVTERVRIEEMMIQTEKMLSVGGLAAGMAHEIKNPLGGILQNTQVLSNRILRDLPKNLRVAKECGITMDALKMYINKRGIDEMVNMILDSGKRAIQIIENMLSFSRKSASKPVLHNLTALLNQTVEIAKSDYDLKKKYDFRDIEIIKEYDEATPEVQCEASKIQQVYFNILKNGAEAMIEAGVDKPRFILRAAPDADGARIEIEDNGPGMNDETRSNIFEPFFTTKGLGEGTGLGLSVSYFIITENHGGAMTIDSTPGKGARFIIRLPREMEE